MRSPLSRFRFSLLALLVLMTVVCIGLAVALRSPRQLYRKIEIGMSLAEVEAIVGGPGSEIGSLNVEDIEFVEDRNVLVATWPHLSLSWERGSHQIAILVGRDGRVVAKYYKRIGTAGPVTHQLDRWGL